jgi:quercetin dioxygenase-like cupin family protein
MTIKEIIQQLETADHPVAKALHKGDHFKVLVIGFKSGMKLKEHEAHLPSKLTVISGQVIYRESTREVKLNIFDEVEIAVNIRHSVEATEDSICLLTQG